MEPGCETSAVALSRPPSSSARRRTRSADRAARTGRAPRPTSAEATSRPVYPVAPKSTMRPTGGAGYRGTRDGAAGPGPGPPPRARATHRARAPSRRRVRLSDPSSARLQSLRSMAQRKLPGLQRVLGVNALFSTAYGNVGSSIYYALGLVASFALGLTPVVFVIAGIIFYLTAATYAEATAMYPEAGGSSSFARHAFNEFWSFFAAWAQMLNYVITIAISAFFVPHYIGGLFWHALSHSPGDIVGGIFIVALLAAINVGGVKEAAGLNIGLAVVDFSTQLLLVVIGLFLVFSPHTLVNNVHLGVAPTWKDFFLAIPVAMIAYTGIETISNMAEEAKDVGRTVPAAIKRVVIAVFAIYALLPAVALS